MATAGGAAAEKIDGRRSRAASSRRRIVAALMELIREGAIQPTAEAVAARADVGLRTVFRHFADMETLYREIAEIDAELARRSPCARPAGRWASPSIDSGRRVHQLMPFGGDRGQPPRVAFLRRRRAGGRAAAAAPGAARRGRRRPRTRPALDLVLSFEAWLRLRRDQGLSRMAALRVMQSAALALAR
jgi:AcrR family transcriptional regulator